MTRDIFSRLAFMVACSAWAAAVALVWLHLGWIVGASALAGGTVFAFLIAADYERSPSRPAEEPPGLSGGLSPEERPRGLGHREIARRARAARGDDEE